MNKTYLCVGINDYPGAASDLSGCVNEAMDWSSLLSSRGYSGVVMLDSAAIKQNVVSELERIVSGLRYRDRFVFTYSGHGTWVPDGDGDEIDGRDEALCCHDLYSGGLLTDDELHRIFSKARYGTQITVLSDSCHSGTVARGLLDPNAATNRVPKFVSPGILPTIPVTIERAMEVERYATRLATSRTGPVLISGCDDPEYSYDAWFGNRANGAFTRAAIDTFKAPSGPPRSFREWHRRIRGMLPSSTYPQTPQLGATLFQSYRTPIA